MAACEVVAYDIAALKDRLLKHSQCSQSILDAKIHTIYFEEYFAHIGAKTMVVEREYVDHDYLEDFAGYYVKCFPDYDRKCTRLHFFSTAFGQDEFENLLKGAGGPLTGERLQNEYLGFIVVKPLPQTIIGRTCLRTYNEDPRRNYPITREYHANLTGFPLSVKRSLAFQEQDSVVAACATSALWSAFHGTGMLFQHYIPSPVEITKAATEDEPSESRNIPNKGLSPSQMARAIRAVGLEPLLVNAEDPAVLRNTVYAYVRGRVPLILGIVLFDDTRPGAVPVAGGGPWKWLGQHAVAVTGFSLGKAAPVPEPVSGLLLESSRIDRLYVHDDGVGPFSRLAMDERNESFELSDRRTVVNAWSMHTSWRRTGTNQLGMRAVPLLLMAPLYNKIRIPYGIIEDVVRSFDEVVTASANAVLGPDRMVWDISLGIGADLKAEVVSDGVLLGEARATFLQMPLPRFVWRARARFQGRLALDLLFDATDIQQGKLLTTVVRYDAPLAQGIRAASTNAAVIRLTQAHPVRHVLAWFAANL